MTLRHFALSVFAASLVVCCGCSDTPSSSAASRLSAPPKPAELPAGEPEETPAKPGTEVPTQLGGPQFKQLIGARRIAASDPGAAPTNTAQQPAVSGDPSAPTPTAPAAAPSVPDSTTPPAVDPSAPTSGPRAPAIHPSAPKASRRPPMADPSAPTVGPNAVRAEAGVTGKGQGYGNGDAGLITVPISEYFGIREQIVFQQVDKAMNNFKTFNGRNPKSHEEFMKEIIKENAITLPELPEGSKYVYDPGKGELMVDRPSTK